MLALEEIADLVAMEEALSDATLHLTANETVLSPLAEQVLSGPLYNRYLLEHVDMRQNSPSRMGGFLFRGMNGVNEIEQSATQACKILFDADYVEFRCLSGLHAMQTTIASLTNPGDKVMRFSTDDGGHFATEHLLKLFGRKDCTYVLDIDTLQIDLDKTATVFEKEQPKLLYIDAMNYLFPFPLRELKEIVGDKVPIVYDASHTLGLIAGGRFQNPLAEGADVLQANTHKTLFGPQKGIILTKNAELYGKISYDLSHGLVSSQHTTSSLCLFVALHEMVKYGEKYANAVIANAKHLAGALDQRGFEIIGADNGYTENHQFFVDVTNLGAGPAIMEKLLRANISVNRTVPFENVDALRLGVQEVTRRGYTPKDLDEIADLFQEVILEGKNPESYRGKVAKLVDSHGNILYCDNIKVDKKDIDVNDTRVVQSRWIDYRRSSFDLDYSAKILTDARELGSLASRFREQTETSGNVSIYHNGKVFVTRSGSHIGNLEKDDLVRLDSLNKYDFKYSGQGIPSSEAYMHHLVLQDTGAKFVVHNHYLPTDKEVEKFAIQVIPPEEIASIALAESVANACKESNIVYIQKHGLVVYGQTVDECKRLLNGFDK